jgi:hypothetical protein
MGCGVRYAIAGSLRRSPCPKLHASPSIHAQAGSWACRLCASSLVRTSALCSLPPGGNIEDLQNGKGKSLPLSPAPPLMGHQLQTSRRPMVDTSRHGSVIWHELFAMTSRPRECCRPLQEFPHSCYSRGWPLLTALSNHQAPACLLKDHSNCSSSRRCSSVDRLSPQRPIHIDKHGVQGRWSFALFGWACR